MGRAEVGEIDRLNIYWAGILSLRRAVLGLDRRPEHLLIDARRIRDLDIPQDGIVHGDALSLTIAAASILAKTTRDALMARMDEEYPGYGFARHKGYPTPDHVAALRERAPAPSTGAPSDRSGRCSGWTPSRWRCSRNVDAVRIRA